MTANTFYCHACGLGSRHPNGVWCGTCWEPAQEERDATVADLDRMLGVCEYPEVRAFLPLLIERIRKGEHRARR